MGAGDYKEGMICRMKKGVLKIIAFGVVAVILLVVWSFIEIEITSPRGMYYHANGNEVLEITKTELITTVYKNEDDTIGETYTFPYTVIEKDKERGTLNVLIDGEYVELTYQRSGVRGYYFLLGLDSYTRDDPLLILMSMVLNYMWPE